MFVAAATSRPRPTLLGIHEVVVEHFGSSCGLAHPCRAMRGLLHVPSLLIRDCIGAATEAA
jgi:hypothetical protein